MNEQDLFVIVAGGSGAKVAESLLHLCAAGLGPPNVHILIVDGDSENGNRVRTVAAWSTYEKLQAWPWLVTPAKEARLSTRLFRSKVRIYTLAEGFDQDGQAGLLPQVQGDKELTQALQVLLNEGEMTDSLKIGFAGRPNLGSIVMSRYLQQHLKTHDEAAQFLKALELSAKPAASNPRVIVVGSVFGGTGASLLPIARGCINALMESAEAESDAPGIVSGLVAKLKWGKVMLLPYFQPARGGERESVNSNRHLTDTASALWYYGQTASGETMEPSYLIGSESPENRIIPRAEAGERQTNPAFYHELLAALAILDFCENPDSEGNRPIRHASAPVPENCVLDKLLQPSGCERDKLLESMATLLHLAAFWLNWRTPAREPLEYRRGLLQFAREANKLPGWDPFIAELLATRLTELTDLDGPGREASEYFSRLLLWSITSLGRFGATGLDFLGAESSAPAHYSSLHNTLCYVKKAEVQVEEDGRFAAEDDNLAAALCRLAVAGLKREARRPGEKDLREHKFKLKALDLVEDGAKIRLGLSANSIGQMLADQGMKPADVNRLCKQYGLPEQAVKT